MVKVNLVQQGPLSDRHHDTVVEMSAVPRVGDSLALNMGDGAFSVIAVIWTPFHKGYDVQVRFR